MTELPDRPPPSVDPTLATNERIARELALLEVSISQRVASIESEMAVRLLDAADLRDEKFARVEQQFGLIERQRQENKLDTKLAVDAALQAQKEAVREQTTASERAIAKSETATNKQLEQLSLTFATSVDALRRSIDEIKERISDETRNLRTAISEVERRTNGGEQRQVGAIAGRTAMYAAIGAVAAIVTIGAIILAVLKP